LQSAAFTFALFEFVLLIFSLSFHECSHAWMASRLGDQTARLEGRITLNPMYHMDLLGTLLIPGLAIFGPFIGFNLFSGILIGWAKPTPVITRNFRKIVRDDNLVTLAGPASNLLLMFVALAVLLLIGHLVPGSPQAPSGREIVVYTFQGRLLENVNPTLQAAALLGVAAIQINLSLFFFNLLPIPPLDGSHLLRNALPYNAMQAYDRIPYWVSFVLMVMLGGYVMSLLLAPAFHMVAFVLSYA